MTSMRKLSAKAVGNIFFISFDSRCANDLVIIIILFYETPGYIVQSDYSFVCAR